MLPRLLQIAVCIIAVLASIAGGLKVGFDSIIASPCAGVATWTFAKARCPDSPNCYEDMQKIVTRLSEVCKDPKITIALPHARAVTSSVRALTVAGSGAPADNPVWLEAETACKNAGGRDCSRPVLIQMANDVAKDDSKGPMGCPPKRAP